MSQSNIDCDHSEHYLFNGTEGVQSSDEDE